MGKRNRKSIRWAERTLLALLWLTVTATSIIPAYAQQGDIPPPKSDTPPAVADDRGNAAAIANPESMLPHSKHTRFWLSGQMNLIFQTHPDFHADYSGRNSLSPHYEKATSRVMTLYTGVRLNNSTELLVDIEEAGGQALSTGLGLAGNTDLDIVRNPSLSKAPYLGRAMIHKVFALSKDKIENQRTYLSLFDELPRRRLEIRFGKFSMPDFFDLNSVGTDTHFQFSNWSVDNNGAWDRRRTLRYRHLLVRQMVQMKNRISGLLMETGVSHNKQRLHKVKYFRELLATNQEVKESIRPLLRVSRDAIVRLQKTEYALVSSLQRDPLLAERIKRLRTVPGVGPITALTWALEMGDVSRFPSIREAVSYCGLCGDEKSSADKVMRTPLSKQRNKHIQRVLVEAAKLAPRQDHNLALVYEREKQKGNANRATLAVARKMVAYLLAVDRGQRDFVPFPDSQSAAP